MFIHPTRISQSTNRQAHTIRCIVKMKIMNITNTSTCGMSFHIHFTKYIISDIKTDIGKAIRKIHNKRVHSIFSVKFQKSSNTFFTYSKINSRWNFIHIDRSSSYVIIYRICTYVFRNIKMNCDDIRKFIRSVDIDLI